MGISIEQRAGLVLAAVITAGSANAGFILENGPGNGSVSIEVDGYGSFGFGFDNGSSPDLPGAVSYQTADGRIGDVGPFSATFIGFGGEREALSRGSIDGSGNLPTVPVTDDNGSAVSSFTLPAAGPGQPALQFNLRQSLQPLFSGIARTGSILVQEYSIRNQSLADVATFDLVRLLDANLAFDGSADDGGGLLNLQGDDFVFVTDLGDTQTGTANTTFAAVEADNPGTTGFLGSSFLLDDNLDVLDIILDGGALTNSILDDNDGDGFVDPASATNLAIAYGSAYVLAAGESTTFTARTIFGSGAPADVIVNPPVTPDPVPTPASILLMLFGLLGMRKLRKH